MEVFVHKVMKISESYEGFLHFEIEASFEDTFALGPLKTIYLKEELQNEVFVDKGLTVFNLLLALQYVLYFLYDIILVRCQLLCYDLQSLAQLHIGNRVDCTQHVGGRSASIELVPTLQKEENLI